MKTKRVPLFTCLECGKKFYTTSGAEHASNNGCPKCGGGDIAEYVKIGESWRLNET